MPLWKNYCFHQKPHYSPNLPHHSKVSKRRVVSFLTLGHTESSTFGAIDKRETALACQMVIFTEQTKTFPVLPLLKQIMLSVLRVTLARAGWELQGGGAGQWWSWLLVDAAEVSGDRMPSHHHTLLQQRLTKPWCSCSMTSSQGISCSADVGRDSLGWKEAHYTSDSHIWSFAQSLMLIRFSLQCGLSATSLEML